MPYQKKDKSGGRERKDWNIRIPTRHGGSVQRSARTESKTLAKSYEGMFRVLGPYEKRAFDVIDLVLDRKIEIAELYRAYVDDGLDELRARFAASPVAPQVVDLDPLVEEWFADRRGHARPETLNNYRSAVRTLIAPGVPFLIEALTTARIAKWLAEATSVPGTAHYLLAALRHFIKWLIERGDLTGNPAHGVVRPRLPDSRVHYLSSREAQRLADAQPSPFREFSAMLNGTGGDVSLVLRLRVRDVDVVHHEIHLHGVERAQDGQKRIGQKRTVRKRTVRKRAERKREERDRVVRVADWAWPYVEQLIAGKEEDDLLFDPGLIDRFKQYHAHTTAVIALVRAGWDVYDGYMPKDSRHTFAVRLIRAGVPAEAVAQQLGHKDARMVHRVYGRFAARQEERAQWERLAQAWDERMSGGGGPGAPPRAAT